MTTTPEPTIEPTRGPATTDPRPDSVDPRPESAVGATLSSVAPLAPWRRAQRWWPLMVLAGIAAFVIALVGGDALVGALLGPLGGAEAPAALRAVAAVIPGVLALALTALAVLLIERRRPSEFAFGLPALRHLLLGWVAGALVIAAGVGVLAAAGAYRVEVSGWTPALLTALGGGLAAALAEETLFRGVLLRVFEGRIGTWPALVLTSALFGVMHAGNPGATVWTSMGIAIQAGLLLGACWMLTQNLWLACGLHAGWNATMGGVFGISVSGNDAEGLLRTVIVHGPEWLTGGSFGLEGSVVGTLVCLAVAVPLLVVGHRRGLAVPVRS